MTSPFRATRTLALLLLADVFLYSDFLEKPPHFGDTVGFVAAKGLPFPALSTLAAPLIETIAPLTLVWPRTRAVAAIVLALYCLAISLLFHDFWHGDNAAHAQLNEFLKNLGPGGAFLFVWADVRERAGRITEPGALRQGGVNNATLNR